MTGEAGKRRTPLRAPHSRTPRTTHLKLTHSRTYALPHRALTHFRTSPPTPPMYKTKPALPCTMPSREPLRVLLLNGSLRHEPEISNTGELADLVLEAMGQHVP